MRVRIGNVPRQTHPTKQILIDTVIEMLKSQSPEELTSEHVLEVSRVSRGSLYHHFEDFGDLIESALAARYARFVDESVSAIAQAGLESKSREEYLKFVHAIAASSHGAEREAARFMRSAAIGAAANNARLRSKLAHEQERLTAALADLIREAQSKGFLASDFEARAAAVFIQSYTLGKVIDDVAITKIDQDDWNSIVTRVIDRVFFADASASKN